MKLHLVVGTVALASGLPPAPNTQLLNLTSTTMAHSEPSIVVDPFDPMRVAVAYQVPASVAYSLDGGDTWQNAESQTWPSSYAVSGDVALAFSKDALILSYIAFDQLGPSGQYWAYKPSRNGVFTRRSLDGGKTWDKEHAAVIEHPVSAGLALFEDKPTVVADNSDGPYSGLVYVGWTQFSLTKSEILVSRSTDGAKTWSSTPIVVSSIPGNPRDDNGDVEGFTAAVGSNSRLYVTWADRREGVAIAISDDGAQSFSTSFTAFKTAPLNFGIQGMDRCNGFPVIAVSPMSNDMASDMASSTVAKRNRSASQDQVHIMWSDFSAGDVDVYLASSLDGAATFGKPVRVNDDTLHNGKDQYFPWMALDPVTGKIYVVFLDRRNDPSNHLAEAVLAVSRGAQAPTQGSFENYQWGNRQFAPGGFMGDYTWITVFNGTVFGAWTEAQGSEQDLDESLGEQAAALLRNQRQGKQGWTKANETVSHGDTDSGSGTFIVVGKALFQ